MYNSERHLKTWVPPVPEDSQLSNDDITQLVKGMTTVASLAIFNKTGSNDSAAAMQCLAMLRPEVIIPPLLDMYVDSLLLVFSSFLSRRMYTVSKKSSHHETLCNWKFPKVVQ